MSSQETLSVVSGTHSHSTSRLINEHESCITFTIGLAAGSCLQEDIQERMNRKMLQINPRETTTRRGFGGRQQSTILSCIAFPYQSTSRILPPSLLDLSVQCCHELCLWEGGWELGPVINSIQFLFPNHFNSLINLLIVFGHEIHKTTRLLPLFLVFNSTPSFRSRTSDSQTLNFNIVLFIYLKTKWIVKINLL